MTTLTVTANIGTPPDRPGVPLAQILRDIADTLDTAVPVPASYTLRDKLFNTTRATYTYA